MRDLNQKIAERAEVSDRQRKDNEAMNARFRELFSTDLGQEVLKALREKFPPHSRRFKYSPGGGPIDPLAAAVRDGEGAVINYIDSRIEAADK